MVSKASKQLQFRRGMALAIGNFRQCRDCRSNPRLACRQAVAEYQLKVTARSRPVREA